MGYFLLSLEVFVTSFFGGPGCTEDSALSTPFDAVQFESIRQPIMFRERMEIVRCDASWYATTSQGNSTAPMHRSCA